MALPATGTVLDTLVVDLTTVVIVTIETIDRVHADADSPDLARILVPLDGSEWSRSALVPAAELARRTGARLDLLTTALSDGPVEPTSFLDDIADDLGGLEMTTVTSEEREPAAAIEAAVGEGVGPTLIVMSSHGRGGIRRAVLGSVAEHVVATSSAPVLVTGPGFDPATFDPDGPVLVAHDGQHRHDIEAVARLARSAGGRINLLEIVTPPTLSPLKGPAVSDVSPEAEDEADGLRRLGLDVSTEARRSQHPDQTIAERAERIGASYLVVATRARTGPRRVVLGSVASHLVGSSPVPVLVIPSRPEGDDATDDS